MLLVKNYRPFGPHCEEAEEAWKEYKKECPLVIKSEHPIAEGVSQVKYKTREDPLHWFIAKFGNEKGKDLYDAGWQHGLTGSSWECRDCVVLDDDEYFEKLRKRYEEMEPGR
jgi:hypothetical protein